jgi:hypothetical protein
LWFSALLKSKPETQPNHEQRPTAKAKVVVVDCETAALQQQRKKTKQ